MSIRIDTDQSEASNVVTADDVIAILNISGTPLAEDAEFLDHREIFIEQTLADKHHNYRFLPAMVCT